jgi:hypothetical protein
MRARTHARVPTARHPARTHTHACARMFGRAFEQLVLDDDLKIIGFH